MADIHGQHKAMIQCFERSGFNPEEDTLIQLGDVVDRGLQSFECVEELLKIKNLISIKGNHDDWFYTWLIKGKHPADWLQGGYETLQSYANNVDRSIDIQPSLGTWYTDLNFTDIPLSHQKFFKDQKLYYVDSKHRMFVHGGFDRSQSIEETHGTNASDFYWNRDLWKRALSVSGDDKLVTVDGFNEIFIGHTPTCKYDLGIVVESLPQSSGGVWNIDTGAGANGKLTIMDIDTKEYWQSDLVTTL